MQHLFVIQQFVGELLQRKYNQKMDNQLELGALQWQSSASSSREKL